MTFESQPLKQQSRRTRASGKDQSETHPAIRRVRRIVWNTYYKYFSAGHSLLELHCGTAEDALELASNGIHIVATDPSAETIATVHRKLHGSVLNSYVSPLQLSLQRLRTLKGRHFDGAYSSFGGLNTAGRLQQVAGDLAKIIKPGGHVVLCLMSDFSLWETASFLLRGKWKRAFRRRQPDGVLADMHGEKVWIRYYSPRIAQEMFQADFEFVEMKGLNVLSPPASARTTHRILGKGRRFLDTLEDALPSNSRVNGWGDQYVIVFRRKR